MNKFFTCLLLVGVLLGSVPLVATENNALRPVQQTLCLIKPEAVAANRIGPIIACIEANRLRVVAMKMTKLTTDQAALFYAAQKVTPFYKSLVGYMSSGPIVAMVLEGEDSIETYRKLMGPTDPAQAPRGTLRREFGTNVEMNAVHGSESVENAKKEIAFFFTDAQIYSRLHFTHWSGGIFLDSARR